MTVGEQIQIWKVGLPFQYSLVAFSVEITDYCSVAYHILGCENSSVKRPWLKVHIEIFFLGKDFPTSIDMVSARPLDIMYSLL